MPPRPVPPERTALLARAASAIRAVRKDGLDPHQALAMTVWPTDAILAAEAGLPFRLLEIRVRESRAARWAA